MILLFEIHKEDHYKIEGRVGRLCVFMSLCIVCVLARKKPLTAAPNALLLPLNFIFNNNKIHNKNNYGLQYFSINETAFFFFFCLFSIMFKCGYITRPTNYKE